MLSSPRESSKAVARRQQILAASARLLPSLGVGGIRLLDISKEAGVSIGMLQHYFESRDNLIRETFKWASWSRLERWKDSFSDEEDPWKQIVSFLEHLYFNTEFHNGSMLFLEFCTAAGRDRVLRAEMSKVYDEWRGGIRGVIEKGTAMGRFRPAIPIEEITDIFTMLIDGAETAVGAGPRDMTLFRLLSLQLQGIGKLLGVESSVIESTVSRLKTKHGDRSLNGAGLKRTAK